MKMDSSAGFFPGLSVGAVASAPAGMGEESGDTRILLTYGGHKFDQASFFEMFDLMPGVECTRAEFPESADLLRPGLEEDFDVVVMYDMVRDLGVEHQRGFTDLLDVGIGLVSLHHNLCGHPNWGEFCNIIGGKFIHSRTEIDGTVFQKTGWKDDQQVDVHVHDSCHPITAGLRDFTIHDESYGRLYVRPEAHVLLSTDHPECNSQLAWTNQYSGSRVVYIMLGHDDSAWGHPVYPVLLSQAIRWAGFGRGTGSS